MHDAIIWWKTWMITGGLRTKPWLHEVTMDEKKTVFYVPEKRITAC